MMKGWFLNFSKIEQFTDEFTDPKILEIVIKAYLEPSQSSPIIGVIR